MKTIKNKIHTHLVRGEINKMEKEKALKEREELQEKLKDKTLLESERYNIERRIGDLNQFVINV